MPEALPFATRPLPRLNNEKLELAAGRAEISTAVPDVFCVRIELPNALPDVHIGIVFATPAELVVTVPGPHVTVRVIEPVALPPFVTQPEPVSEFTPLIVPVAPLNEVTPVLVRTFPTRLRPVEIEVVPSQPEESRNASVLVAVEKIVELLNVAVLFAVTPPLNV